MRNQLEELELGLNVISQQITIMWILLGISVFIVPLVMYVIAVIINKQRLNQARNVIIQRMNHGIQRIRGETGPATL